MGAASFCCPLPVLQLLFSSATMSRAGKGFAQSVRYGPDIPKSRCLSALARVWLSCRPSMRLDRLAKRSFPGIVCLLAGLAAYLQAAAIARVVSSALAGGPPAVGQPPR